MAELSPQEAESFRERMMAAVRAGAATVCPCPAEPGHGTGCTCGTALLPWAQPASARAGSSYADIWFGDSTTYPTGRGQQGAPVSGWQCPGCGSCYSPYVSACWHCPGTVTATGANPGVPYDPDYER